MQFIEPNLEEILNITAKLDSDTKPQWGSMNAQRMIEHLADSLRMASGKEKFELVTPEDKLDRMIAFLESDKPMAKNIEVNFAGKDVALRNEELELAIDELVDEWLCFEGIFEENPSLKTVHPYYGELNFEQWLKVHKKHLTHHFQQFGLI